MQEPARVELPLQMIEQAHQLAVVRPARGAMGKIVVRRVVAGEKPFVAQDQHGLGEIERGEGRIHRDRDDGFGNGDVLVVQARFLAPEEDSAAFPGRDVPARGFHGGARRQHRLQHVTGTGRGGVDVVEPGHGVRRPPVDARAVDDDVGAGSRRPGLLVGPGIPGPHQTHVRQSEIQHGAGGGTDVLAHLGLDEHDGGTAEDGFPGPVGSRHDGYGGCWKDAGAAGVSPPPASPSSRRADPPARCPAP